MTEEGSHKIDHIMQEVENERSMMDSERQVMEREKKVMENEHLGMNGQCWMWTLLLWIMLHL